VATGLVDFSEDRIRCGGPDEWLRSTVGILDVVINFLEQVFHATERSPTNGLLRNAVESDLHLI
jgi:hypothetical protein